MIVWSGWGILAPLFALLAVVVGGLLDPLLPKSGPASPLALAACLIVAAVGTWLVGTRLNSADPRELVDPKTGQRVVLRSRHTLFWIPMQYFAILIVIGAAFAVAGIFTRT